MTSARSSHDFDRLSRRRLGPALLDGPSACEKQRLVQVWHANYDTHNENFNFHMEQLGELDRAFAAFISPTSHDRGMLG